VHSPDGSADRLTAEVSAYSIRAARHATPIAPPAARRRHRLSYSPDAASRREPTGLMVPGSAEYEYLVTYE